MGTHANTTVEGMENLAYLYRQMDGYPTGHGAELVKLLKGHKIINGINTNTNKKKDHNGLACLFAYVVSVFKAKSGIGGFYLQGGSALNGWSEYVYILGAENKKNETGKITLKVYDSNYTSENILIYTGLLDDYTPENAEWD